MKKNRTAPRVENFDWRKANFEEIAKGFRRSGLGQFVYGKDVIEKWRSFEGEILRVQNLYVPVRLKRKIKGLKAPWFSRDIGNLVRKKREIYNKCRQHGVNEVLEEYKDCKKNLKKEIRKANLKKEIRKVPGSADGRQVGLDCQHRCLCRKAQSRLYFLRRLASFNVCKEMLRMFYRSVVERALFYGGGVLGRQHQEEGRLTS